LTCLALLAQACLVEPQQCTAEIRAPLAGDVFDKNGYGMVPDRVTVSYSGSSEHECSIEPPVHGASRFICVEGKGTGVLTAYYGAETTSKRFKVLGDGCHAVGQEVDLKFE
jgi:hypothetical protein